MTAALVLCGGRGTRLRAVLPDRPKPMAGVAGRPFLDWLLLHLRACGIRHVVLSTGHKAEVIGAHYATTRIPGMEILCAREPVPLGTGGAVVHAASSAEHLHGWARNTPGWLVLNGDSLAPSDYSLLPAETAKRNADAAILAVHVPDASRFGTLDVGSDGHLRAFQEKHPGAGLINAGVYYLSRESLSEFPARRPLSMEREAIPGLLERGRRIIVPVVQAPFIDIGIPESLASAGTFLQEEMPHLNNPLHLAGPENPTKQSK
ncbi:MAG: nucleotidyltransferase family protein [Terrimicrobiaceae bacterium]|nr:nucleotidyltransferase family protein [Terrimicrobiaceae bacterium]